ncbi:MAG: endonuclease V [Clostridiaceae bacterium]
MNKLNINQIYSEEECIEIQKNLSKKIIINSNVQLESISKIAGIDIAYWKKDDDEYAVCCIVVINSDTKEVIEKVHSVGKIEFPYIPGCLAFRELPLVLETVGKLQSSPDVYIFDGNGYLHPRHMGVATHASMYLNKPTIGVAKSYHKINNVDFIMPENQEGAYTDIVINNEVYGRVLRTHKDVKPIFLSVGNYIDLETSTKIVSNLVAKESHIPIPTRLADLETHEMRRLYK